MKEILQSIKTSGAFLRPESILPQLPIKRGFKVADLGAGSGYFTVLMAQLVGSEGKIFAIDVLSEALEAIRSRAKLMGVANIETKRANLEIVGSTGLQDDSVDMVLIANILFQSQKKNEILKEAVRLLKAGGFLVLIDWQKDAAFVPKGSSWPLSQQEAQQLGESVNLKLKKEFDAGSYHWGLIFSK